MTLAVILRRLSEAGIAGTVTVETDAAVAHFSEHRFPCTAAGQACRERLKVAYLGRFPEVAFIRGDLEKVLRDQEAER